MEQTIRDFGLKLKWEYLKNFDFSKLKDWEYLFYPDPPRYFKYSSWVYVLAFLLFLVGLAVNLFLSKRLAKILPIKKFISRIGGRIIMFSIILLVLNFFRTQGVAYLSMRFLMVLWVVSLFVYLVWEVYCYFRMLPEDIKDYYAEKTREKYLPKKRGRATEKARKVKEKQQVGGIKVGEAANIFLGTVKEKTREAFGRLRRVRE